MLIKGCFGINLTQGQQPQLLKNKGVVWSARPARHARGANST